MQDTYTKEQIINIIEKLEIYHKSRVENGSDDKYETMFEQNAFYKCLEMMEDMFGITNDEDVL